METALQELEETLYWLELLQEIGAVQPSRLEKLMKEADELTAILVASVKTVKRRHLTSNGSFVKDSLSSFIIHVSSLNKKALE